MIGHNPRHEDFVPGFRFLTAGWGPPLFEPFGMSSRRVGLLMEVVSRDGMAFVARDQNRVDHKCRLRDHQSPDLGKDVHLMNREIVWCDPLPNGSLESVAAFADVLLLSGYRNPSLLLHCMEMMEDGTAVCSLIHTARKGGLCDWRMGERELDGETVGGAWFSDETIHVAPGAMKVRTLPRIPVARTVQADRNLGPGPQWIPEAYSPKTGDLFTATKFIVSHDEQVTIVSADMLRIAEDMDRTAIGAWLPVIPQHPRQGWIVDLPLGTRADVEMEIERALARREPDEIVVISVPLIAPTTPGDVHLSSLSHSGIRLHETDALDDDLYGTDLEPGVWIGEDVAWHDCGEDGAEWSASWRRANRDDLDRHGLSFDEVAENWTHHADLDVSAADIEVMMDRDLAAEEAETAARAADADPKV